MHRVHSVVPSESAYEFTGQGLQFSAPPLDWYWPFAHAVQSSACGVGPYFPGWQLVQ